MYHIIHMHVFMLVLIKTEKYFLRWADGNIRFLGLQSVNNNPWKFTSQVCFLHDISI